MDLNIMASIYKSFDRTNREIDLFIHRFIIRMAYQDRSQKLKTCYKYGPRFSMCTVRANDKVKKLRIF